jgi:glycosyltransferase involved in cell wall biosynthesis
LKWVSEADKGIYDALNKGVKMAGGKWVYFLGADDRLLPGFSELAAHVQDERTVYYGNSEAYSHEGEVPFALLQGAFSAYRLAKYCMNHQSIIYPAAVFHKYTYDLRYKASADYALNLLLWGDNSFKKQHYPVTVVLYNMTGFSAAGKDIPFMKDKLRLIRKGMGWSMYLRMVIKRYKHKLLGKEDLWAP